MYCDFRLSVNMYSFVYTSKKLAVVENLAFTTSITIILNFGGIQLDESVSLKFRHFQNNSHSNDFRCTGWRSDCCVLCPNHMELKSINGSAQLWIEFLVTRKPSCGLFTPKCTVHHEDWRRLMPSQCFLLWSFASIFEQFLYEFIATLTDSATLCRYRFNATDADKYKQIWYMKFL